MIPCNTGSGLFSTMTIVRIVRRMRNAIGWPVSTAAPAWASLEPVALTVTDKGPRHDPIFPSPVLPARSHDHDAVPRRHVKRLPRLRLPPFACRMLVLALAWGLFQYATASPPIVPRATAAAAAKAVPPVPGSYFAIVLVSVRGEPVHPIAPNYVPDVFYADRSSCLKGTRASVREMAAAGISGRFLCMYPREPDAELDAEPREEF